jgi:hypothetical protein
VALKVLLNISKAHYQMEQYGEAEEYYAKAKGIDPEMVVEHAYLNSRRPDETRAAEGRDLDYDILFVEEE